MEGTPSLLITFYNGAPPSYEPGSTPVVLIIKKEKNVMRPGRWITQGSGTDYCSFSVLFLVAYYSILLILNQSQKEMSISVYLT